MFSLGSSSWGLPLFKEEMTLLKVEEIIIDVLPS